MERNPSLVEKLIAHPNFAMRVKEWRDLGMVDETLTADASLHPHYRFLPIDTRYFKDSGALSGPFAGSSKTPGLFKVLSKRPRPNKTVGGE